MADRSRQEHAWVQYHSRLLTQDQEALSCLYDESSSLIYSVALRILGSEADAEEVTLDVYTHLWKSPQGWDPERGSFTSWLVLIARSRSLDRLRRRRTRAKVGDQLADPFATDLEFADPGASPEAQFSNAERSLQMKRFLELLPAAQRRAVELAFYADRTHQEIAEMLGEPLGTIKSRIRTAMLKLKEMMRDSSLEEVCE